MEERDGKFKQYDSANRRATIEDTDSGGTVIADNPAQIIDPNNQPPVDTAIRYVLIYVPPKSGQTDRIINVLKEIRN